MRPRCRRLRGLWEAVFAYRIHPGGDTVGLALASGSRGRVEFLRGGRDEGGRAVIGPGAEALFHGHRGLLPGAGETAGGGVATAGAARGAWLGVAGARRLAVAGTARENCRRHHDEQRYSKEDLAELYRQRWHVELDLRSIKCSLEMDYLRTKSPAMVQRDVWVHLLAYNLIRKAAVQAALTQEKLPRHIGFAGTRQTIAAS